MDTRAARLARAAVTASVCTLVTAVSHAAAGGDAPHPALLLVAFALALIFCLALTSRALSPSRLIVAVAASQTLLHGVFAMSGPPPAALLAARTPGTPGMHGMHGTADVAHATGMAGMPDHRAALDSVGAATHAAGVDAGMLVAHVLAGAVTVLALVFGERAFWGAFDSLRLAGSALLRFVAVAGPVPALALRRAALVIAGSTFRPRPRERLMLALRHRGPPVLAA